MTGALLMQVTEKRLEGGWVAEALMCGTGKL